MKHCLLLIMLFFTAGSYAGENITDAQLLQMIIDIETLEEDIEEMPDGEEKDELQAEYDIQAIKLTIATMLNLLTAKDGFDFAMHLQQEASQWIKQ